MGGAVVMTILHGTALAAIFYIFVTISLQQVEEGDTASIKSGVKSMLNKFLAPSSEPEPAAERGGQSIINDTGLDSVDTGTAQPESDNVEDPF